MGIFKPAERHISSNKEIGKPSLECIPLPKPTNT